MCYCKGYNMDQMAIVLDIIRGTTHDGPGIRNTIFLKGCPLSCLWCQNPESIEKKQMLQWEISKCIGCYSCVEVCNCFALQSANDVIKVDYSKCNVCGKCVEICPAKAMQYSGENMQLQKLVEIVNKDKHFFDASGGGVTVSGGEPLIYGDFVAEFFRLLQNRGIHTALDTSGFSSREVLERVLNHTDLVLYDLKLMDDEAHKKYTGVSNKIILDNFIYICKKIREKSLSGRKIALWVRTPLVPEATGTLENIKSIGEFIKRNALDIPDRWELCAFNSACIIKYKKLGREWFYENQKPLNSMQINELKMAAENYLTDKVLVTGII